jgi:Xaa-Pro aminopeptidase
MLSPEELLWLNDYHARVRRDVRPSLAEATKLWLDDATVPLS